MLCSIMLLKPAPARIPLCVQDVFEGSFRLLCSLRDLEDIGVISLNLVKYRNAVRYAYVYDFESLTWVAVVSEGTFTLREGERIRDNVLKCRKGPHLLAYLRSDSRIRDLADLIKLVRNSVDRSSITIALQQLPNNIKKAKITLQKSTSKISIVKSLRTIQEELIKHKTYSAVKCGDT